MDKQSLYEVANAAAAFLFLTSAIGFPWIISYLAN